MYQALFVIVAVAVAACAADTSSCAANLSADDFSSVYCSSDLVFRGSRESIYSGMQYHQNGTVGVIQFYSFKSTELFKGSPNNASDIGVERGEWSSSFPCSQVGLPNTDGEYFVFATGSGSLFEVETCNRIFAWDCIPQSDKDRLPLTCSN